MVYNARLVNTQLINSKSGEDVKRFKVYSLEQEPENMWKNSPLTPFEMNEEIRMSKEVKGIGYIISWPNLIKQCSFVKESVNEKTCFHPPRRKGEPLVRYPEMETGGCLAEEIIGGDEARIWLGYGTLERYLEEWSDVLGRGIVLSIRKLP